MYSFHDSILRVVSMFFLKIFLGFDDISDSKIHVLRC